VSERGDQLADRTEQQISEMIEFLTGLTESDLNAPCRNEGAGSTVGSVAVHIAEGYGQATRVLRAAGFLMGKAAGGPAQAFAHLHGHGPAHGHSHGHDHPVDLQETIGRLKDDGMTAANLLRGLTDEQLDSTLPPIAARFADVTKPLGKIIEGTIDHQAAHLDTMKVAVTREPSQEPA
jgi:hypothetical protein